MSKFDIEWKARCNGSYFIAAACNENTTRKIAKDFFNAGYAKGRQQMAVEVLEAFGQVAEDGKGAWWHECRLQDIINKLTGGENE